MMVYAEAKILIALAFNTDGKRDEARDEWLIDPIGWIEQGQLKEFCEARYGSAIKYEVYETTPLET